MSMIGHCVRISSSQLDLFVQDPSRAAAFVYPEDDSYPEPPIALDLDKSWHLIHFLLAGEAWGGEGPVAAAILGGEELKETDAGYGPFRYLYPAQVLATADALKHIDSEELWQRFDAEKVAAAEIYPSPWEGGHEEKQYIVQNFEELKQFYADAAKENQALLLYIA